jgi:hypothetical protein
VSIGLGSGAAASGIQGGVSTPDELLERVRILERCQADTHRRPLGPLHQTFRHLVKSPPSAFDVGARKRAEKLVASVTDDQVIRPQSSSHRDRYVAEQSVTNGMALQVVDRLETIDVDEGENESAIRATRTSDLPPDVEQAAATRKRAGQHVNSRRRALARRVAAIMCGALTIARSFHPVPRARLAVVCRLLALAPRRAAGRPFLHRGGAIASLGGAIASFGGAVAFFGGAVASLGTTITRVDHRAELPGRALARRPWRTECPRRVELPREHARIDKRRLIDFSTDVVDDHRLLPRRRRPSTP